jgi:hypothetical protein
MNLHVHWIGVVVGSCVLASAVAHAQVTKVVAEPATTVLNFPVKVQVTGGRAQCRGVVINFDDGQGPQQYVGQQLPFEVSRSWPDDDADKLPNIKVIKAKGVGCGGEAETTVTVLEEFKPLVPLPKIETYLGFAKPGGVALILGKAFGTTQGKGAQARLKDWKGVAKDIDLKIIEWKPTGIGVEWPSDLAGLPFHDASIWVTRADGKSSNKYTVQFKPTLELKMLPQSDVKVVSCSSDANSNQCNDADPGGDACAADYLPFFVQTDSSIHGNHYNCWGVVGDDSGTDTYQITLANDWALEQLVFDKFVEAGEGWVKSPASTFPAGASQWTAKIEWNVTPSDNLRYEGIVFIRGPKGVPHK